MELRNCLERRMATRPALLSLLSLLLLLAGCGSSSGGSGAQTSTKPNILFVILDDVGIDQMELFGYGGQNPTPTPNIDAIAQAGVSFRNTWAMPECSPSRAVFFDGRYGIRNNVIGAISSEHLANSQVSPYEVTTPELLHNRGYQSALFGKFHLGGPENNPYGEDMPHVLGWDYFYGFLAGSPTSIDETAGGVSSIVNPDNPPVYNCGFVPSANYSNGADNGACYFSDGRACENLTATAAEPAPGLVCATEGGIMVPNQTCQSTPPSGLNFFSYNAYYVSPLVIIDGDSAPEEVPTTDARARQYRTTLETNAAVDWINSRPAHQPWMATVSYSSAHVPLQQPPYGLVPAGPDLSGVDCSGTAADYTVFDQMVESADYEIGQLLVNAGLAKFSADGHLIYDPKKTNTLVVIVGDNGSYAPTVRSPFNPTRAKGTPYQTGVWVPLVAAGPMVRQPGRDVTSMINIADLFELFGDVAGIDVHQEVPPSHTLDSVPMLPYLTNPNKKSIRTTSFTGTGNNITAGFALSPACLIPTSDAYVCAQLFSNADDCGSAGGTFYQDQTCCQVQAENSSSDVSILPDFTWAIRNDQYKLVESLNPDCENSPDANPPIDSAPVYEFYEINEAPGNPKLDNAADNLLDPTYNPQGLTPVQQQNFDSLKSSLQTLMDSYPHLPASPTLPTANYEGCPGDGNLDLLVNDEDLSNWSTFQSISGESSWYDMNFDGLTNDADQTIIQSHLGTNCLNQ
jgi:arylsulfatase A-like enzyme